MSATVNTVVSNDEKYIAINAMDGTTAENITALLNKIYEYEQSGYKPLYAPIPHSGAWYAFMTYPRSMKPKVS